MRARGVKRKRRRSWWVDGEEEEKREVKKKEGGKRRGRGGEGSEKMSHTFDSFLVFDFLFSFFSFFPWHHCNMT